METNENALLLVSGVAVGIEIPVFPNNPNCVGDSFAFPKPNPPILVAEFVVAVVEVVSLPTDSNGITGCVCVLKPNKLPLLLLLLLLLLTVVVDVVSFPNDPNDE